MHSLGIPHPNHQQSGCPRMPQQIILRQTSGGQKPYLIELYCILISIIAIALQWQNCVSGLRMLKWLPTLFPTAGWCISLASLTVGVQKLVVWLLRKRRRRSPLLVVLGMKSSMEKLSSPQLQLWDVTVDLMRHQNQNLWSCQMIEFSLNSKGSMRSILQLMRPFASPRRRASTRQSLAAKAEPAASKPASCIKHFPGFSVECFNCITTYTIHQCNYSRTLDNKCILTAKAGWEITSRGSFFYRFSVPCQGVSWSRSTYPLHEPLIPWLSGTVQPLIKH